MGSAAKSERDILTGLPFFLGAFAAAPREGKSSSSSFFLRGSPRPGKARSAAKLVLVSSSSAWSGSREEGARESASASRGKIYMRSGGTAAATTARDGEPRERRTREEGAAHHHAWCAHEETPARCRQTPSKPGRRAVSGTADGGGAGRRFRASFFHSGRIRGVEGAKATGRGAYLTWEAQAPEAPHADMMGELRL